MYQTLNRVPEITGQAFDNLPFDQLIGEDKPVIFKGLARDLPLVQQGLISPQAAMAYINSFYQGKPVLVFTGEPDIKGRFSYNKTMDGFNFSGERHTMESFFSTLTDALEMERPPHYYLGSTDLETFLPGLLDHNSLNFNHDIFHHNGFLKTIWIGNETTACAHYDISHNMAVCMAGHRRFTLFPPSQIANLYPGPLEPTPGGQVISLVDFTNPDFTKYPKFAEALTHAQVAELEPGDVLYYPSMWWHQVEALDRFNVLINYWWDMVPDHIDTPATTLLHALLSLRQRPSEEKQAWKAIFDYYIFGENEPATDHIEPHAQGALAPLDGLQARRLRAIILNKINR